MQENAYLCWPAETSRHRRRSFILNSPKLGIPKCPSEEEEDVWLPGHWKTKEPQTILYTSSEFLLRHRLFENTLSIDLIVVTFSPYNNKGFSKIMEIVSPLTVSYKKDQEKSRSPWLYPTSSMCSPPRPAEGAFPSARWLQKWLRVDNTHTLGHLDPVHQVPTLPRSPPWGLPVVSQTPPWQMWKHFFLSY